MLMLADYIFYFLAAASLICAVGVVCSQNPIYSAFCLALSMIGVAGIFVTLNATFLAGVQIIVYAGAVMVLFVMVLMLFDLKHEMATFSKGLISGFLKLASVGVILGLIMGSIYMSAETVFNPQPAINESVQAASPYADATKALATTLFTKYIFGFEVIGFLLLVIAIGAVTLSRISGGTHADH
jgi:NADH-quinone oxidoreductase subunit J